MRRKTATIERTICAVVLLDGNWLSHAGSLNPPPGPVTGTMKTLDEVEARTPISTFGITISTSGSYYFTQNLDVAACGGHGIVIDADDVTLDLNGFTLSHTFNCSLDGIHVSGARRNIAIMNGTVRGFSNDGVDLSTALNSRVSDLNLFENGQTAGEGLQSGEGSYVVRCTAENNGGRGIVVGASSTIRNCTAQNNGNVGFLVNQSSTISHCSAQSNQINGFHVVNSTITHCTAGNNTGAGVNGNGILISQGLVADCTTHDNQGDGIEAFNSLVHGNTSFSNGGMPINNSVASSTVVNNHAVP